MLTLNSDPYLDPNNLTAASDGSVYAMGPHGFDIPLSDVQCETIDRIAVGDTPAYDQAIATWRAAHAGGAAVQLSL